MPPASSPRAEAAPPLFLMDFRSSADDAWYSAAVKLEGGEGEILRVMFLNFSSSFDELYRAESFRDEREIEEFAKRFRPISTQLQDWECRRVRRGTRVVASVALGPKDLKFYDAIVDSVTSNAHPVSEGKCSCTFVVHWQHGPLIGKKGSTTIENICLLQRKSLKMDPTVAIFLDAARQSLAARKFEATQITGIFQDKSRQNVEYDLAIPDSTLSSSSQLKSAVNSGMKKTHSSAHREYVLSAGGISSSQPSCRSPIDSPLKKCRYSPSMSKSLRSPEAVESYRKGGCMKETTKVLKRRQFMSDEDVDLGGDLSEKSYPKRTLYFFCVENLEMDISAYDIMDFILEKTSVTPHAFIWPSTLEEFNFRGTILVETEKEANKLFEFLYDSSHMVISSGGRPWLTNENWCGSLDGTMPRHKIPSKNTRKVHPSKLKLVHKGTKEYEEAKQQQALHSASYKHIQKDSPGLMEAEKKSIGERLKIKTETADVGTGRVDFAPKRKITTKRTGGRV